MIIESSRYEVRQDRYAAFAQGYAEAATVLREPTHSLDWEVAHGYEYPQRYVVRIE